MTADKEEAMTITGLDAAWAEAEAAVPEHHQGWRLILWGFDDGYQAEYGPRHATGDTPAAALRALAACLTEDESPLGHGTPVPEEATLPAGDERVAHEHNWYTGALDSADPEVTICTMCGRYGTVDFGVLPRRREDGTYTPGIGHTGAAWPRGRGHDYCWDPDNCISCGCSSRGPCYSHRNVPVRWRSPE